MTVAAGSAPDPDGPEGGLSSWRISAGSWGLEVRAGRHLHVAASPALLLWLASLSSGAAGAHWFL